MTCDGVYGIIPGPEEFLADLVKSKKNHIQPLTMCHTQQTYTSIDIVQKFVHSVVLTRGDADPAGFGKEIELLAHLHISF